MLGAACPGVCGRRLVRGTGATPAIDSSPRPVLNQRLRSDNDRFRLFLDQNLDPVRVAKMVLDRSFISEPAVVCLAGQEVRALARRER